MSERRFTAQGMRCAANTMDGCLKEMEDGNSIHWRNDHITSEDWKAMLRYAAGVVERCEEANRLVNAMINSPVTATIDGIEYYQPFMKKDVMELAKVLRGDAGKEVE